MKILISPNNYSIQPNEKNNIYIQDSTLDNPEQEHANLVSLLHHPLVYTLPRNRRIRDSVFVANSGLSLWGLPHLFILSNMKYAHRKEETDYIEHILHGLHMTTFRFPKTAVFEGQGETCWFHHGSLLFFGYGYRATLQSYHLLEKMISSIYLQHGKKPPRIIPLELIDPYFYHLDFAMLKFSETKCIVQSRAFSKKSMELIYENLGKENVHLLHTKDTIALNSIVQGKTLITPQVSKTVKQKLEDITGLTVKPVKLTSFEKSGGSVQCMILNIHSS